MQLKLIKKLLVIVGVISIYNSAIALSVTDIYQHLNSLYPGYANITYSQPTVNYLGDNWLIQTPNIWGKSIDVYNTSFNPSTGNAVDSEFYMPTCSTQADCSGYSKCMAPDYTLDINGKRKMLCTVPADNILSSAYNAIVSANSSVDILTLRPLVFGNIIFSTQAFTATIKNALIALAKKSITDGKVIQIRLMQGSLLPIINENSSVSQSVENTELKALQSTYLKNIVNSLPQGNHLNISIGSMRSCQNILVPCGNEDIQKDPYLNFAFNHGKIIAVDGKTLITGGHNLLGLEYLQKNPVNDLSIEITGPIVNGATRYANTIWDYTCTHKGYLRNLFYTYKDNSYSETCLNDVPVNTASDYNQTGTEVLAMPVAKLNNNVLANDADQSEIARVYAFNSAVNNIKISQQALFTNGIGDIISRPVLHPLNTHDGDSMEALANAITRGVQVSIVTSSLVFGSDYSSFVDLKYIWNYLDNLLVNSHGMSQEHAHQLLEERLHLGVISYGSNNSLKDRSHNKVWIVDDKLFYVGSHNMYPTSLQQFGVIIDSTAATGMLESAWWEPLWKYSQKVKF